MKCPREIAMQSADITSITWGLPVEKPDRSIVGYRRFICAFLSANHNIILRRQPPQHRERINPRRVTIRPKKLQGVPPHLQIVHHNHILRNHGNIQQLPTSHLLNTTRTTTLQPKIPIRIQTRRPVRPTYRNPLANQLHTSRNNVRLCHLNSQLTQTQAT